MAIFDGIMEHIRIRKRQAAKSSRQKYLDLLRSVASGKESDLEDAWEVIESVAKSEVDFGKDITEQQKRFKLAAQRDAMTQVASTIPSLERAASDAQSKLNAAIEQLQPLAMAAARRLRDAQNSIEGVSIVEQQLMQSCLDLELLEREAELLSMRMALVRKKQPLDDDLKRARAQLRGCESSIENFEAAIAKNKTNLPAVAADKRDLEQVRSQAESLSETVSDLATAVGDINSELEPVESELAAVRKAKLLP